MPHFRKLGRIFHLDTSPKRSTTHTQVPTIFLKEDVVRVYFAARRLDGKSYPGYVDLARSDLTTIVKLQEDPIIELGKPGTFDDEGIMPACVISRSKNEVWMYYSGWNQRVTVPYHNSTGIAVSWDGGDTFTQLFAGPVMDRTPNEPYLAVTPSILFDGNMWRCWYISGLNWTLVGKKYEPVYVIKYASSTDGVEWNRPNVTCIAQHYAAEAFSHPTVVMHGGKFHMWYCYRHSEDFRDGQGSYRIGYGISEDGIHWDRKDASAGILPSDSGWDSTMQCYPYVIEIDGSFYMFYNGNSFGQSGIGLAVLESWST